MEDTNTTDKNDKQYNKIRCKKLMNQAEKLLGFKLNILLSWCKLRELMFKPTDPTSLAVFRILFGITMFFDVPDERGFSRVDERWGQENQCTFPLIHWMEPLPFHWMCFLYLIMWLGTIGIILGYKYYLSCLAFCIPYWYIILLDKTAWNNHTYLFGLTSILLSFTQANACWSLDKCFSQESETKTVPFWNYVILRYQVFILYFMAGLKKFNSEWLGGYSMTKLSNHTVFKPFKLILSNNQIDYWIVHVTGFLIDFFGGFGLYFDATRPITLIILLMFHLMNSRLFSIGMFPYVGIVTMFVFCNTDWPRRLLRKAFNTALKPENVNEDCTKNSINIQLPVWKQNATIIIMFVYMCLQLFLPFSHVITKGYNGWTNGLYGYSWDMMVHNWDTSMVRIKVINNNDQEEYFMNPKEWVQSDRWAKHPDMVVQYAKCVKDNILKDHKYLKNISIYIDVWCSLNGRLYQRMFDPRTDILAANWSPFKQTPWLMPLLTELTEWRYTVQRIQNNIYSESENADVVFLCDFPGLHLENYINGELINTSIEVLKGRVLIDTENNQSVILNEGSSLEILPGTTHHVYTISDKPSCYMYSYINNSLLSNKNSILQPKPQTPLAMMLYNEFIHRLKGMRKSISFIAISTLQIMNDIIRIKSYETTPLI